MIFSFAANLILQSERLRIRSVGALVRKSHKLSTPSSTMKLSLKFNIYKFYLSFRAAKRAVMPLTRILLFYS